MFPTEYYYFWDIKQKKVGLLYVLEKYDSEFRFEYGKKTFRCSYEYAKGKLYKDYREIPEYQDMKAKHEAFEAAERQARREKADAHLARQKREAELKQKYDSAPDPETFVVFGD